MKAQPTQQGIKARYIYLEYGALVDSRTNVDNAKFDTKRQTVRMKAGSNTYNLDKLIWCFHNGVYPDRKVVHKDGNPKNCAIENLSVPNDGYITKTRAPKSGYSGLQEIYELDGTYSYKIMLYHSGKVHYGGVFPESQKAEAIQKLEELRFYLDQLKFKRENKEPYALGDLSEEVRKAKPGTTIYVQGDDYQLRTLHVPRTLHDIRRTLNQPTATPPTTKNLNPPEQQTSYMYDEEDDTPMSDDEWDEMFSTVITKTQEK